MGLEDVSSGVEELQVLPPDGGVLLLHTLVVCIDQQPPEHAHVAVADGRVGQCRLVVAVVDGVPLVRAGATAGATAAAGCQPASIPLPRALSAPATMTDAVFN